MYEVSKKFFSEIFMIILYTCICRLAIKLINEISITRYVTTAGLECTTKTEILNINKRVFCV